jgi:hypothetical protein
VTSASDIRVGDVIMRDDTSSAGASTAHSEVVTGVNPLTTTGAHARSASETQDEWLAGAPSHAGSESWIRRNQPELVSDNPP